MRWIVLLRGVNVGGHGKTPMAALRDHLHTAGAENVLSYIQSGNLIFDHPETDATTIADWTSDLIAAHFAHRPPALAWTPDAFRQIIADNPFGAEVEGRFMTFHLFHDPPKSDCVQTLTPLAYPGEVIELAEHCLYHWPPNGIGKSKLAQQVPRALGVTTTARNLNSMHRILDLA